MAQLLAGRCHCGAIRILLETDRPLAPRACQCRFCRRHNARSISDPQGSALLTFAGEPQIYRFASRAADYFICNVCGVYVAAVAGIGGRTYATLNLNAFDDPHPEIEAVAVSYEGESDAEKSSRRRQLWTPVRLSTIPPNSARSVDLISSSIALARPLGAALARPALPVQDLRACCQEPNPRPARLGTRS